MKCCPSENRSSWNGKRSPGGFVVANSGTLIYKLLPHGRPYLFSQSRIVMDMDSVPACHPV